MKVGDLVRYPGNPGVGVVTNIIKHRVYFVGFTGYKTWTHIGNVQVISESR